MASVSSHRFLFAGFGLALLLTLFVATAAPRAAKPQAQDPGPCADIQGNVTVFPPGYLIQCVVPPGVSRLKGEAWGAVGGDARVTFGYNTSGGRGGYATRTFAVSAFQHLNLFGGQAGGNASDPLEAYAGGGGSSGVYRVSPPTAIGDVYVLAGAGGGAGCGNGGVGAGAPGSSGSTGGKGAGCLGYNGAPGGGEGKGGGDGNSRGGNGWGGDGGATGGAYGGNGGGQGYSGWGGPGRYKSGTAYQNGGAGGAGWGGGGGALLGGGGGGGSLGVANGDNVGNGRVALRAVGVPGDGDRCTIEGTPGGDVLLGTPRKDTICGFGGNDRIYADEGRDRVLGGPGDDLLSGNLEPDRLFGGLGKDRLIGGQDADLCRGGGGTDQTRQCEAR